MSLIIPNEEAGANEIFREAVKMIFDYLRTDPDLKVSKLGLNEGTMDSLQEIIEGDSWRGDYLLDGVLHKYHCDLALLGISQR